MRFSDLLQVLRQQIKTRIEVGLTSGSSIARSAGFRQAHVSNFLLGKRGLSFEGADALLEAENMTVFDLLPEISQGSSACRIPVVPCQKSAVPNPEQYAVGALGVPACAIQRPTSSAARQRRDWLQFVAVLVEPGHAPEISLLPAGSIAVIDRHYDSTVPPRGTCGLCLFRQGNRFRFGYIEVHKGELWVRNDSPAVPGWNLRTKHTSACDVIVGRVVYVWRAV